MNGITIINWNIGGAKYLETVKEGERQDWLVRFNSELRTLLKAVDPHVVTLQEVVRFGPNKERAACVLSPSDNSSGPGRDGYESSGEYHDHEVIPAWLIDTDRHSHMGKWEKLYSEYGWERGTFFAQGNVTLVRKDVPRYGVCSLPTLKLVKGHPTDNEKRCTEEVPLECGLYFGDRNTEPRAAMVTHLVFEGKDEKGRRRPCDVFVVNLHLTTLMREREGIPLVDEFASRTRNRQLEVVLDGVVSRYNDWRKSDYVVRDRKSRIKQAHRLPPIWLLAGDFNFTPESLEYQTLVRRGFVDMNPIEVVPTGGTYQARDKYTKAKGFDKDPTITLDYVFVGPRFEAVPPTIGDNRLEPSDDNPSGTSSRHKTRTPLSDHSALTVTVPMKMRLPDGDGASQ